MLNTIKKMLKKLLVVVAAVMLLGGAAFAEGGLTDIQVGFSDQPLVPVTSTYQIQLASNPNDGCQWTGVVLGGESVEVELGGYTASTTWFQVTAVKPGKSVLAFAYSRGWGEEGIDYYVALATVSESMQINVMEINSIGGVKTGMVLQVNKVSHTAMMNADSIGSVQVEFPLTDTLPAVNSRIAIYTDGTMSKSMPPVMFAIAWQEIASVPVQHPSLEKIVYQTADKAKALAGDESYLKTTGANLENMGWYLNVYAQTRPMPPLARYQLKTENVQNALQARQAMSDLSAAGSAKIEMAVYSPNTLTAYISGGVSAQAMVASSVTTFTAIYHEDVPSCINLLEYANGAGIIVSVWNNGAGMNLVTASFIPDVSSLKNQGILVQW